MECLRTNALKQMELGDDDLDVDCECVGQPLGRYPSIHRSAKHPMLLNRGQAIDLLVVGVGLIICRDQAGDRGMTQLAQCGQSKVSV